MVLRRTHAGRSVWSPVRHVLPPVDDVMDPEALRWAANQLLPGLDRACLPGLFEGLHVHPNDPDLRRDRGGMGQSVVLPLGIRQDMGAVFNVYLHSGVVRVVPCAHMEKSAFRVLLW